MDGNRSEISVHVRPHAIVVPGPGLAHINASLSLAASLHSVGFNITLVCFSTAFHYHSKSNRMRPMPSYVNLQVLPDGNDNDTASSYYDLLVIRDSMPKQLMAFMEQLLHKSEMKYCIIPDVFMGPVAHPVAEKLRVPRVDFVPRNATAYLQLLALPDLIARGYYNDSVDELAAASEKPVSSDYIEIKGLQLPRNELFKTSLPILQTFVLPGVISNRVAERVLVHSTYELERPEFDSIRQDYGINAFAVGPLLHDPDDVQNNLPGWKDSCLTWLDSQPATSVAYVSFGSIAELSKEETVELALGLEDSGERFLWVDGRTDNIADILPSGFLDRNYTRGKIVPWAPQPDVLAHPAVGGFLSHCGWNSTMEALWNGAPMLTCPRASEQHTNARLITREWCCGVDLKALKRDDVRNGVNALMSDQDVRSKAHELKALVRKAVSLGGSSHSNLVQFANDMLA